MYFHNWSSHTQESLNFEGRMWIGRHKIRLNEGKVKTVTMIYTEAWGWIWQSEEFILEDRDKTRFMEQGQIMESLKSLVHNSTGNSWKL